MKKAIIFDLDGTLWDATGCSVDIWNRVFDKHGKSDMRMTQEISSSLMGKTMPEIGEALFPNMTEEERMSIVNDFGDEEVKYLSEHGANVFDSVEETLSELEKDYDLYIVSNCQDGYVPAFLHAHNMGHHFKDIEMSGRTGMDKGNNIKLIMKRNSIDNAVYVGDTAGDESAARYAGLPFVWAAYGFGKAESPDEVIQSIGELPNLLLHSKKMNITFGQATKDDIPQLIRLRHAYMQDDFGSVSERDKSCMEKQLPDYFERKLGKELFAFVARDGEKIVSVALLLTIEMPANPNVLSGFYGEVLNVFTQSEYRGKGLASTLMKNLIAFAKEKGLSRIDLSATDAGFGIYEKLGFKEMENRYRDMRLKF